MIFEKIKQVILLLDEIDQMIETRPVEMQKIDWEISDWLHYIENNNVDEKQTIKIMNRLKELRKIRRTLRNENAIEDTYKNNSNKMMGNNTRQFLLQEISKTVKQLKSEYKNRIITDEQINAILNEAKKRGRPKKEVNDEHNKQ